MIKKSIILFVCMGVNVLFCADPFHRPKLYFPTSDVVRKSSYPFISGDTFRRIADHIFDETDVPFDPLEVEFADTIFINADMLEAFFTYAYPLISNDFILISHNSDKAVPGRFAGYLNHSKIIAWFAQNMDRKHSKLYPLPIGLANHHWPHGKIEVVKEAVEKKVLLSERDGFRVYVNFLTKTNMIARNGVWKFFCNQPFSVVAQNRPYGQYLREMGECKFVISPPGNGIDCHRHWEALLMGSIPIMRYSSINTLFDELPVIFIYDWRQVNETFIRDEYVKMECASYNYNKLYADYWIDRIKEVQQIFQ